MYDGLTVSPFLNRDCTTAGCVIVFLLGVWVAYRIANFLFKDKTNE